MNTPEGSRLREVVGNEVFGLGARIPIFSLKPARLDPDNLVGIFSAGFILNTQILPDLMFGVSLGEPVGSAPNINMFRRAKNLYLEADADPLVKAGLAKREPTNYGTFACFGHYELYDYTYNDDIQVILERLRCRVYDGEDGKIYEAGPSQRALSERGKISFAYGFVEVNLDQGGFVIARSEREKSLTYDLGKNTGAENTEAEFILATV